VTEDAEQTELYDKDGYVPSFLSIQEYGDYIDLEIDNLTGKIMNWVPIKKEDLKKDDEDE
jgi:hypothetical protein